MFTPAPVVPASYFEMRKQGTVLRLHLKKISEQSVGRTDSG